LVGHVDHPDFQDARALLQQQARLVEAQPPPELIVLAQSRPGEISEQQVQRLRQAAPLAGMVGLLGSWCEGESRTGRPWPGVERLYWYEFPAWWRRQLELRAAGSCPDWSRPVDFGFRISDFGLRDSAIRNPGYPLGAAIRNPHQGLIVICTHYRDTADALADVFHQAGYASIWQRSTDVGATLLGVTAGIWDGGQLDEREAADLARFCRVLTPAAAPVMALLDFPRRDRVESALQIGAAAVYGKPWLNEDLLIAVQRCARGLENVRAA
jgi:hypothetical protein